MSDVVVKAINGNAIKQGNPVVLKPGSQGFVAGSRTFPAQADTTTLTNRLTDRFAYEQDRIARAYRELPDVSLTTALGTTPNFDFRKWAGGNIMIPAGSSITSLTFYSSLDDGNYVPLNDSTGSAVALTVAASGSYPIPDAVFGCSDIKIVSDAAGSVDMLFKG